MNNETARFAQEMRWFFHCAKSEMGIRSSWDPLVQVALTGGAHATARSAGTSDREERRRGAVWRHARIEQALCCLDSSHLRLIRLTCEEELWPLRKPFGDLGNAAHLTDAAYRAKDASRSTRSVGAWLDRLSLKYAAGRAGGHGLDAIDAIRLGCEVYLEPAREAYVKAMGRIPHRRAA